MIRGGVAESVEAPSRYRVRLVPFPLSRDRGKNRGRAAWKLSYQQARILEALAQQPADQASARELKAVLGWPRGGISRSTAALAQRGLIRHVNTVAITTRGRLAIWLLPRFSHSARSGIGSCPACGARGRELHTLLRPDGASVGEGCTDCVKKAVGL